MENLLIVKKYELWVTKSTHLLKMQPFYAHANKLIASDVKICFPALYLNLHAQYSHMANMPQGGTSPGLPFRHISRNPIDTPIPYRQIHTSATYYKQSFYPATIVLWNRLPSEIALRADLGAFFEGVWQINHQSQ